MTYNVFSGTLNPTHFTSNTFGIFCSKLLTDKQTGKHTNNDENFAEVYIS